MIKDIFAYADYRAFLVDFLAAQPAQGRGQRSKLATFLGCQTTYVSAVLGGRGHFSLEQGEAATRFFALAPAEREFFLTLVQLCRAATPQLRAHFKRSIQTQLDARSQLHQRVAAASPTLSDEDRSLYYSSWLYAAAHMLAMVPGYERAPRLAERLGVSDARLAEILAGLEAIGVIRRDAGRITVLVERLNLPGTSPLVVQHHTNWRVRAINAVERRDLAELHYSGVAAIARADIPKLREALIRAIVACAETAKESKADDLCAMTVDLFRL